MIPNQNIYLHIGLPKTATCFFQDIVFTGLNEDVVYNPREIMDQLRVALLSSQDAHLPISEIKASIEGELKKYPDRKILISNENMILNNYSLNYRANLNVLKQLFPNAKVIFFLRFQADWCLAMYKQSIQQGCVQEIESFLNYVDGEFKRANDPDSDPFYPKINVQELDYAAVIEDYREAFSTENINIFFFEDFVKSPQKTVSGLLKLLNTENNTKAYNRHYRSLSALAIKLLNGWFYFFNFFGLRIPYECLPGEKTKLQKLANLPFSEVQSSKPMHIVWLVALLKLFRRARNVFTWKAYRDFMQGYFDKVIYIDWDLLKKNNMRQKINEIASEKNQRLKIYIPEERIPKKYLSFSRIKKERPEYEFSESTK